MEYRNLTPFPSLAFDAYGKDQNEFHVAVLRATYEITPDSTLRALSNQPELLLEDQFPGEISDSSVEQESDLAPFKPKCDIIVSGSAYAPGGKPVTAFEAGISIHSGEKLIVDKRIRITGPRIWKKRLFFFRSLTQPELIDSLPLMYGYSAGGSLLPNAPQLESPIIPIQKFKQSYVPETLGVMSRTWPGRLKLAGTYDEEWQKTRHPHSPVDFNESYWNGAHPDLQVPWLSGNEHITLHNLSEQGHLSFDLPGDNMLCLVRYDTGEIVIQKMNLDTLVIEPEFDLVSCVWRLRIPIEPSVRVLEVRMKETVHA